MILQINVLLKYGKDVFRDESKQQELALFAKDEVMQIIISDLADLGVVFDSFVSEKITL